jgi:hypothetical protein
VATYQELAKKFARCIFDVHTTMTGMLPELETVIDALPYYGDHNFQLAHRGALANLLQVNLPNDAITPQDSYVVFGGNMHYSYSGPYSGYRDAFYHGVSLSPAASNLRTVLQASNVSLNDKWWCDYSVIVLTDAIRQTVGGALDAGKLSADLTAYNKAFLPTLTASCYAVFNDGFSPTSNAIQAIKTAGKTAQADSELVDCILAGQFTANINQAIAMGGESTAAAIWFLFNLWITLKALGNSNVDDVIRKARATGLEIPPQVDRVSWWNGGYTSWWTSLSGSDVSEAASGTIRATMPQSSSTSYPPQGGMGGGAYHPPSIGSDPVGNGYCWSLVKWGKYNNYSTCCFGKGTGVLMADGSVKPIELVQIGDEVQSDDGPRKVILVESPPRAGRTLYRPNRLNIYATAGHPFRTPPGTGPARRAVDPWDLMDSAPTMTEHGVDILAPGCRLLTRGPNGPEEASLTELLPIEAASGNEECLYDLLIEKRNGRLLCYYVGGPGTFLAVDSETADPLHSPATTVAIVTALSIGLPNSRQHLANPGTQIPGVLTQVKLPKALAAAQAPALSAPNEKPARPSVPDPDFYLHEGAWDPHASMLEGYLVRHFARMLRRETAMGWRTPATPPKPGDLLTIVVHDVQLIGGVAVGSNAELGIELCLRGWDSSDRVHDLKVNLGTRPIWDIPLNHIVAFGQIPQTPSPATLFGRVTLDAQEVGRFMATMSDHTLTGGTVEYFLFNDSVEVVGRIALESGTSPDQNLILEREQQMAWKSHHASARAVHLGSEIGRQIATHLESRATAHQDKD